jgi:hypothetical protein
MGAPGLNYALHSKVAKERTVVQWALNGITDNGIDRLMESALFYIFIYKSQITLSYLIYLG